MDQNVACGTPNVNLEPVREPCPEPEGFLRLSTRAISIGVDLFPDLDKVEQELDQVVRTVRATLATLRQNQAGNER